VIDMLNSKNFKVLTLAVIFSLLIPFGSSSAFIPSSSSSSEELETLQIEIKYNNGDRADAYQTYYVVYQDHNKTPFLERNLETNPDFISLPKDHQYQIKVFVNGIFSESGFIELKNEPEKLNINIPLNSFWDFFIISSSCCLVNSVTGV